MLCTLYVHGADFSKQDVVINPSHFTNYATVGALVAVDPIHHDANSEDPLAGSGGRSDDAIVLQIKTLEDVLTGHGHIRYLFTISIRLVSLT